jgi:hypothetical protein
MVDIVPHRNNRVESFATEFQEGYLNQILLFLLRYASNTRSYSSVDSNRRLPEAACHVV